MIILGIVVMWVVLLTPFAVRRIREANLDKSIVNYRKGLQIMRRQGYSVQPARLLEDEQPLEISETRPHLRVVRDEDVEAAKAANPYAAYASVPNGLSNGDGSLRPLVSMRVRRARVFIGLTVVTVLFTIVAALGAGSFFTALAVLAGSALVGFVALAFVSVALGYLEPSSLGLRRVATAYAPEAEAYEDDDVEVVADARQYAVG